MKTIFFIILISIGSGQVRYNHPEIEWMSFETENFRIHYYNQTESSARLGAEVAETIFTPVTSLYNYEPVKKTNIIFTDVDDISNGAAYFYDNKIIIWTSPLEFELRGSHRWLQNVITHEFAHIVSIQKSKKFGNSIPASYLQFIGYEKEKRPDVLYGYPNTLISYSYPGSMVPPWLAEGIAQFMYPGADWDNWDSSRDMLLRDQVLNDRLLTWNEINVFGKSGFGNEMVYNIGFALSKYIASKYGSEVFEKILLSLSQPFAISIDKSIEKNLGISGQELYNQFSNTLKKRYTLLTQSILKNKIKGEVIIDNGYSNTFPTWSEDGKSIAYISNEGNDYFGQTSLYLYDLEEGKAKKIMDGAIGRPSFNGNSIYYSKRSKYGNKYGSRFFDIYEFDLEKKIEIRKTQDFRAFNPIFCSKDSSLYYISTHDGTNNIFKVDLKTSKSEKITNFKNNEIVSDLNYDNDKDVLYFDLTNNHFRQIFTINLLDSSMVKLIDSDSFDHRQISTSKEFYVFSDDRSGIHNLYYVGENNQGYISNTSGGSFMPDINRNSEIVYSVFENGKFKIAIIDSIEIADASNVGYSPSYFQKNTNLKDPISGSQNVVGKSYQDDFPNMFYLPRISFDYGTLKPGLYFSTSEILNKVDVIGGVSLNRLNDFDFFINFNYNRLFPTVFFDAYFQTRNISENENYSVYKLDNNLKFRLLEFQSGLKIPFYYTNLRLYGVWSQYRASIKQAVLGRPELRSGIGYDYFKGRKIVIDWNIDRIKRAVDQEMNPKGFKLYSSLAYEKSKFITGLNLSDSGTLVSEFNNNEFVNFEINAFYSRKIPMLKNVSGGFSVNAGIMNNTEVDSFFYFFSGGMPGIKGYPYYSIEGTSKFISSVFLRRTLFNDKNIKLAWFNLQQSSIGLIGQIGDAWNRNIDNFSGKQSYGLEFRLYGRSFYNYPTALGVEYHIGKTKFNYTEKYGNEPRIYLTLLFGFIQ